MYNRLFSRAGLSLERLRTFCEVADAGSMAKAANGDAVRQSLFSRQIKELEEHFGRQFTERNGRNVVLTRDGREFATLARQVLGALEDFQTAGSCGIVELKLGAGENFHRAVILSRLEKIRDRLPDVALVLRNLRGAEIVGGLVEGKLDLGVVDEALLVADLQSVKLGRVTHRLVCPGDFVPGVANWETVLSLPLVGMEGESRTAAAMSNLGRQAGRNVNYAVQCSSWASVADALVQCKGAAIIPNLVELPSGFIEVPAPSLNALDRVLVLAWDGRRGTLRSSSILWQRVLGEVLQF